ncbi:hypothetical protein JTE90_011110 [Oedothorax gibbosus]|uniref:Galactosylceramide sulfotransferase n=1 Tax=Oedothorax gibbosus TaxID=931172 RepID=A0AAV6UCQ0_9ARAC|nr:hypothetical protein JTE90_011110 [Oedothorax gibbosus]
MVQEVKPLFHGENSTHHLSAEYDVSEEPRTMPANLLKSIFKQCLPVSRKLLLFPLATLGIVGFLLNPHISITSTDGICYPKTNIVFLKTHKCAGSTIQNILMRYGDKHKLNFVLPRNDNYLGHPAPFSRAMVGTPRTFSFNILTHHTRLDYKELRSIMPRDSHFVTIVRDPVKVFESSYHYYSFDKLFKVNIHNFIKFLPKFRKKFLLKRFRGKFGANQMFFDLGGSSAIFNNTEKIVQYLDKIASWFDLVLVAERMDESLVLLKHLMCWDLDDVVAFKLNARNPKYISDLSETEKTSIRSLNFADSLLYERFLNKFEREVEAFGRERMAAETAELRRRTQEWYELCVDVEQPQSKRSVTPKHYINKRVMMFETKKNITNSTCDAMTMDELPYTAYLQKRQMAACPKCFRALDLRRTSAKKMLPGSLSARTKQMH